MLLKTGNDPEGSYGMDQFDNPFVHEAFVRSGDGRISEGPVHVVETEGYRLPFETGQSVFSLGAKTATFWAHGYAPVGACFLGTDMRQVRSERGFHLALDEMAEMSGADLLIWPYFPLQSREHQWLISWLSGRLGRNGASTLLYARTHERAFLDSRCHGLADPSNGLLLSRNKRKTLGRQLRRLNDLGTVRFLSTREGLNTELAMERFLKVEASGWKAQKGTALAVDDNLRAFADGFLPQMIQENRAQIELMMVDDYCIAGLVSFRAGRGLFTWKTGMDDVYKRFSPGAQMLLGASQRAIEDPDIDYVDSLADAGHPVAEHIWAGRRAYGTVIAPLTGFGRLASHSMHLGFEGKDRARYWAKRALGRV